jgi:hypothetical protein
MKKVTFIILILISISANAQNERDISIKLYGQLNHFIISEFYPGTNNTSVTNNYTETKLNISPAIHLSLASRYSHELALTNFSMNRYEETTKVNTGNNVIPTGGSDVREFDIGFRYEIARQLALFSKESNFAFELGVAVSPSMSVMSVNPVTSNSYPHRNTQRTVDVLVVPRCTYSFYEKWLVDLNTAINGVRFSHQLDKVENPSISVSEQKSTESSYNFLPKGFEIRIGLGYRI